MAQTTNVGHMSAWSLARSRGYTGTREEYAELMASYATVAQQAAESAQSAGQSATNASQSAQTAETAKGTAQQAATDAQTAQQSAQGYAQSAQQSAQSASQYAQSAESAKDTAVDAVDGFASGAQQALESVNSAGINWKSLAQAHALDSEAWAVGKRGGEDVGAQDATYHNNAKYYALTTATDATTASNAAQTATAKAGEAAQSASAAAESARTLTIDSTLTQSGQAADSKAVGDKADTITGKMLLVESVNKFDPDNLENGYIAKNGVKGDSTSYKRLKTPIRVSGGDIIRFYTLNNSTGNFQSDAFRWMCAYDSDLNVLADSGTNTGAASFTVPDGVSYINPSVYAPRQGYMMTINYEASSFENWFTPYYKADAGFVTDISMDDTDFGDVYLDYSQVNRLDPAECEIGKFINANGEISDNANYYVTNYMKIREGEMLYLFNDALARKDHRAYAYFDANKNVISGGSNTNSADGIPYISGAEYIRITTLIRGSALTPQENMVVATDTPAEFVVFGNEPVFKRKYIPDNASANIHVYLPLEIPVGIGRTIELYNELVCLEANKYHMHWSCSVGVAYARKFSITGTTEGSYPLTLQIFDDDMQMIWTGTSTVKVVANNISSELKILPIGDSLTNLKPWLSEVQSLSGSKIKYIGTRGRSDSTTRHEGRSGFDALGYLQNTPYTFDSNYQGNPNVSGSVNPFWDGTKFSLAYYNTQQADTVGTADAVQLFLGTNAVFGGYSAEESAQHIKNLVDAIRVDYASIPIFVCNTIYRSNQSGYYSSGGQGFTAASGWAFDSDMKIMNFQNALAEALQGYTNVYIVPLSVCMDRENDFGRVEIAVNPRLDTVTEYIPSESVHPQNAGYMQIADVMYSSYIAHLT